MIEYFNLKKASVVNKTIPLEAIQEQASTLFQDSAVFRSVSKIDLLAIIRPQDLCVSIFQDDMRVYEEIHIIQIDLTEIDNMYRIAYLLMKIIHYPVVLIVSYKTKLSLCLSKPYIDKKQRENNTIKGFFHTYWVFPVEPSLISNKIVAALDIGQYTGLTLYDIHAAIFNNLLPYKSNSLILADLNRMIKFYIGRCPPSEKSEMLKLCTPYKMYLQDLSNPNDWYQKPHSNGKQYFLTYDYEDIWYAFMHCPRMKDALLGRSIDNSIDAVTYYQDFTFGNRSYINERSE